MTYTPPLPPPQPPKKGSGMLIAILVGIALFAGLGAAVVTAGVVYWMRGGGGFASLIPGASSGPAQTDAPAPAEPPVDAPAPPPESAPVDVPPADPLAAPPSTDAPAPNDPPAPHRVRTRDPRPIEPVPPRQAAEDDRPVEAPEPRPAARRQVDAVRVGGEIRPPRKIRNVSPVYPQIAQSARVQGVVILEATIGPDGKVTDVRRLRSIPLLDQAALDAVRQWEYEPTLLNGVPVPVIMTVTVKFELH